jgi:hypothetical protein
LPLSYGELVEILKKEEDKSNEAWNVWRKI